MLCVLHHSTVKTLLGLSCNYYTWVIRLSKFNSELFVFQGLVEASPFKNFKSCRINAAKLELQVLSKILYTLLFSTLVGDLNTKIDTKNEQ